MTDQRPETLALHAGQEPDPTTGARAVPIYQTTSFVFDDTQHAADLFALKVPGNIYSRIGNPTWAVLEERVNALEGGVAALALASGQAANTYAILNIARAGDNIVSVSTLYGGTYNLFAHTLPQYGIETRWVDPDKPERLAELVDDKTRLVFAETIGNPKLNVVDLDAWAAAAHAHGLPLIVDNTVPTPILCRAFDHGADVVVHSATKYIGGHGTSIGGVLVDSGNFDWTKHADRFPGLTKPDPSYHGIVWTEALGPAAYVGRARTVLASQYGRGALALQRFPDPAGHRDASAADRSSLDQRASGRQAPREHIRALPGSATRASSRVPIKRLLTEILAGGYGGLVTFGIKGGSEAGARFIESLKLFSHLANIGDAKSLAIHPPTTTHAQLNDEELAAAGVTQDTVRLSIGIEHIDDILADLDQALREATDTAS